MPWTPVDETSVANMAIDVIEDFPIADLNEDTVVGRWMARNFWRSFDDVLYNYPWYFAKKRIVLAPDAAAPAFGWNYSYTLPTDCVRPLPLRVDGEFNSRPIPHEIEGNKILTDQASSVRLIYIRREVNPGLWTPPFARVLAMTLATGAAMSISGKASYYDKATKMLVTAWENATLADTLSSGSHEAQNRHDIVDIRGVGMPSPTGFSRTIVPST